MGNCIQICNGGAIAAIRPLGAELRRYMVNGTDYLWSGDAKVWGGTAPVLFPIVGALKDGVYRLGDKTYTMSKHGIARTSVFHVTQKSATSLTLTLCSSDASYLIYPFQFALEVIFTLNCVGGLSVDYGVVNNGDQAMPFSLGSHPGFHVPFCGGRVDDYDIVFEQEEELQRYSLVAGLLSELPTHNYGISNRLPLSADIFATDALIFLKVASRKVSLEHRETGGCISMDTRGAPYLGVWAKPGAPYVCLEPWFGVDDKASADYDIFSKPGIMSLRPGEWFAAGYQVTVQV